MKLDTLISPRDLAQLMRKSDVLIVDCRFDLADPLRGSRQYALGHIAGAVYASLDGDLSGAHKPGLGRHPLPHADDFAGALNRWGWSATTPVVAYDDANGALAAARLWALLRAAGASDVGVLDGGLSAWRNAGLPLSAEATARSPTTNNARLDTSKFIYTQTLQHLRDDPATLILDARAGARFRGEVEPIDRVAGHIPGARNRPYTDNLQADGRLKSAHVLRPELLQLLGSSNPGHVVHSCGSGVTACHNLLAFEHAGLHGSRLYAPSWSGWIETVGFTVARDDA